MRVLVLNRRDILNPMGGGAELYTHEAVKGLVAAGWEVEHFSTRFPGSSEAETCEGILYKRKGSELTVHLHGFLYALRNRKSFDLIIDEYNGLGFFTFSFGKGMVLIHQLYRGFWLRELGPLGVVPYLLEPCILWMYRKRPAITVSASTAYDLGRLGFKNISIVPNALVRPPLARVPEKETLPTMIFLGRLRSTKKPEDAVKIYERVLKSVPDARLWIAGRGPEERRIREMTAGLPGVAMFGFVDEEKKYELLRRAHVLIVPGVREGFGINVIEAASQGTPAVGYDIPGLRDSIKDGATGFLAASVEDAAEKAARLLKDKGLFSAFSENCISSSASFRWELRSAEFREAVRKLTGL